MRLILARLHGGGTDDWLAAPGLTGRAQQGGHPVPGVKPLPSARRSRARGRRGCANAWCPLELRATDFDDRDPVSGHAWTNGWRPWHHGVTRGSGRVAFDACRSDCASLRRSCVPARGRCGPRCCWLVSRATATRWDGRRPTCTTGNRTGRCCGRRQRGARIIPRLSHGSAGGRGASGQRRGRSDGLWASPFADTAPAPAPLRLRRAAAGGVDPGGGAVSLRADDELVLRPRSEGLVCPGAGTVCPAVVAVGEDAMPCPAGGADHPAQRGGSRGRASCCMPEEPTRAAARPSRWPVVNRVTVEIEAASAEACVGDCASHEDDVDAALSRRSNGLRWRTDGAPRRERLRAFATRALLRERR